MKDCQNIDLYKKDFIDLLIETGALSFGRFELKSKRIAPYFLDTGKFYEGNNIAELGFFYAREITKTLKKNDFDVIFGPAYKGIPLATATAILLKDEYEINKRFAHDRKEAKEHGEATGAKPYRSRIVGNIKNGDRIVIVDDVFTDGQTKYEAVDLLNKFSREENIDIACVGLVISFDRQEVSPEGSNAVEQFTERTGIPVHSVVNISEVKEYAPKYKKQINEYLLKYGTKEAKAMI